MLFEQRLGEDGHGEPAAPGPQNDRKQLGVTEHVDTDGHRALARPRPEIREGHGALLSTPHATTPSPRFSLRPAPSIRRGRHPRVAGRPY